MGMGWDGIDPRWDWVRGPNPLWRAGDGPQEQVPSLLPRAPATPFCFLHGMRGLRVLPVSQQKTTTHNQRQISLLGLFGNIGKISFPLFLTNSAPEYFVQSVSLKKILVHQTLVCCGLLCETCPPLGKEGYFPAHLPIPTVLGRRTCPLPARSETLCILCLVCSFDVYLANIVSEDFLHYPNFCIYQNFHAPTNFARFASPKCKQVKI